MKKILLRKTGMEQNGLRAVGTDKPASNYVKINSVNNFFPWWTLVDSDFIH